MNVNVFFLIGISVLCLLVIIYLLCRKFKSDRDRDISYTLIFSGLGLASSAAPGIKELLAAVVGGMVGVSIPVGSDGWLLTFGLLFVIIGLYERHDIKERLFVLNILGISPQRQEFSTAPHMNELRLSDFKVREIMLDFEDLYSIGISDRVNELIVGKIKRYCEQIVERSKEHTGGFTGMAPIPYTVLAGVYLASGNMKRYFEYRHSGVGHYYELKERSCRCYDDLQVEKFVPKDAHENEMVVALSISSKINQVDLTQFTSKNIGVISISAMNPKNDLIESIEQLSDYVDKVINILESLKNEYQKVQVIHFTAAIPSCVSVELGKHIASEANRLSDIIVYQYSRSAVPSYQFGVYVNSQDKQGKLVQV